MSVGIWQSVLVLLIILVLFGAGKLPQVITDLGGALKRMKQEWRGESESGTNDEPNR